jgi:hypothetical protein
MFLQPVTEPAKGGGMEPSVTELAVEGEVPTRMIPQALQGLTVGNPVEVLQETDPQQQDGLNGTAAAAGLVGLLQKGAAANQAGINLLSEETVTVVSRKE